MGVALPAGAAIPATGIATAVHGPVHARAVAQPDRIGVTADRTGPAVGLDAVSTFEPARQPRAARPRLRHLMADEAQLVAAASVIDFANQHKNIDPSTLGPDEAYKLRKAAREKIRH